MSDRSENTEVSSDVENTTGNEKPNANSEEKEIFSTKRKITHAIRQNPLVHMGEKSEKPTMLEKLKRAFSTDDSYAGGFIDDEPESGGLLGEDNEDLFGDLFNKLRSARLEKDKSEDNAHDAGSADSLHDNSDDSTDRNLSDGDDIEVQPEVSYDEEDALEESDFEFIFAVETDEDTKGLVQIEAESSERVPQDGEVVSFSVSLEEYEQTAEKSESLEMKNAEETAEKSEEVKSEETTEEKSDSEEEQTDEVPEEKTEKITENSDSEETEKTEESEKAAETTEESEEIKSEETVAAKSDSKEEQTDEVSEEKTEEITESSDSDETEESEKTAETKTAETAEESEEIKSEETITEKSGSKEEQTDEVSGEEKSEKVTENSDSEETEETEEAEQTAETTEESEEIKSEETTTEKSGSKEEQTDEVSGEEKSEEVIENSDSEKAEEFEETEETAETIEESENKKESGFSKVKNTAASAAGGMAQKFRALFGNAKNKLAEMWNEKTPAVAESDVSDDIETSDTAVETSDSDITDINENVTTTVLYDGKLDNVNSSTDEENQQMLDGLLGSVNDEQKDTTAQIKLVKNDNSATTEIDKKKVRESLNIITTDKDEDASENALNDEYEILLEEPSILSRQPTADVQQEINANAVDVNNESAENLTDEEKQQKAANQMVLDKVKEVEAWIADQKVTQTEIDKSEQEYEKKFGEVKYITEIEVSDYQVPNRAEEIKVKAGKFSESVRSEYEFYIGYRHLENVAKNQKRINDVSKAINGNAATAETAEDLKQNETVASNTDTPMSMSDKASQSSGKPHSRHSRASGNLTNGVEYRRESDKDKVKNYIKNDYNKSKRTFTLTAVITAICCILFCFSGAFAATVAQAAAGESGSERVFAAFNLVLFVVALYVCRDTLINGFKPLKHFKASADTSVALACAVTAVQAVAVLIHPTFFFSESLNVYTIIALLALTVNTYGRYVTAKRVKENFKFASASFGKYSARFYHDKRMSAKMLSGTNVEKSEIVFQKRTSFLRNFLTLSYSSDPGEDLSSKIAIPVAVFSVIISIVHAVIFKGLAGSLSVLSILLCMAVPMCGRLLGSMPLYKLSKTSLRNQAMVIGYPAVEYFAESGAMMIDAKELYPEGSVHMNGIKTFSGRRIDDALLAAAAVMVNAGGAMAGMFDGIIQGNKEEVLPNVDSVIYEDGKGLIGWVNKERVLVGNRRLLEEHGIEPPSEAYEKKYRTDGNEILYLANSGELVAMFIIGYSANRRVMDALRRMEESGMCILVRTVDVNITPERISRDFGIYYKSVKVLTTGMGNIIRDEMIGKEKTSPAYIATKGGVTPLGRAVSGCIRTKRNISLSLAIQVIEVLISLLLVTLLVLFAGVQQIGAGEMFLLSLLWCVAVIIAPIIQKS